MGDEGLGAPRQGEQREHTAASGDGEGFGLPRRGEVHEDAAALRGDERIGLPMQGDHVHQLSAGQMAPCALQWVEIQVAEDIAIAASDGDRLGG